MSQESKFIGQGIWAEAAQQLIAGDVLTGQVTSATTQATAVAITADITVFATVASTGAAILPAGSGAADILILNGQATNALIVFPPVGGTINGGSANASYSQAVSKCARYVTADGLNWYAMISA